MSINSFVIWFSDGRYTYAWGDSPEDALAHYLKNWQRGIVQVEPATSYLNALPPHRYLPPPPNSVWPTGGDPIPGAPLYPDVVAPAQPEAALSPAPPPESQSTPEHKLPNFMGIAGQSDA